MLPPLFSSAWQRTSGSALCGLAVGVKSELLNTCHFCLRLHAYHSPYCLPARVAGRSFQSAAFHAVQTLLCRSLHCLPLGFRQQLLFKAGAVPATILATIRSGEAAAR